MVALDTWLWQPALLPASSAHPCRQTGKHRYTACAVQWACCTSHDFPCCQLVKAGFYAPVDQQCKHRLASGITVRRRGRCQVCRVREAVCFPTCRTERYIEDTDRFPGWKGELPSPVKDDQEGAHAPKAGNDSQAPAALTMGVGVDGKVGMHPCHVLPQHGAQCSCMLVSG